MVPARAWGATERLKFRRQMAEAAGTTCTTSLSLFMEVYDLEVEEELATFATKTWGGESLAGKMEERTRGSVEKAN